MILGPSLHREDECEAILRSLSAWFGIEESLLSYARNSGTYPTFAFEEDSEVVGFISLQQHFPESWEVHCIAVHADKRNRGIGTRLLRHSENWLHAQGARFLQIKTIAATVEDEHYAQSREFYRRRGYAPVEVFPTLWSPTNPVLMLIKQLSSN